MKISIFTPTHNFKYLHELEESILNQTHEDWEWLVLINNTQEKPHLKDDKRIKVYYFEEKTTSVGKLKNYIATKSTGQIVLEADHDDILTNDCLFEVNKAFNENPEVGFVFSDNVKLTEKDDFIPYNKKYNWTYKEVDYKDRKLISMNTHTPTPFRMSYIWFAPDHVRAWRKSVYDELGGHEESLELCDDLELLIRTYLKTEFYHIKKPLYIYRITGNNTCTTRNKEVQEVNKRLHDLYYPILIDHHRMKYNILPNLNLPKISIITPTYNRSLDIIKNCIHSVLAQTESNWEMLICSDGENLELKKFIESFKDERLFYLHTEKTNDSGNTPRHFATEMAHGKYLVYLDDDNLLFPNYLEKMSKALDQTNDEVGFVICDIVHNGPLPEHFGKSPVVLKGLPVKVKYIDTLNAMLKKEEFIGVGGWDTISGYFADGFSYERMAYFYKYIKINDILAIHL
jgi:glycosyltransferase involved in cell wall biosynthesis